MRFEHDSRLSHKEAAVFERVTGPGLPSSGTDPGAKYSYVANSHLVDKLEFRSDSNAIAEADYSYESERPLLTAVENKWLTGPVTISKYQYVSDGLGRRTSCVRTGTAFSGGSSDHFDLWSYDDRNELAGSKRYAGTDITVLTRPGTTSEDRAYTYGPDRQSSAIRHGRSGERPELRLLSPGRLKAGQWWAG